MDQGVTDRIEKRVVLKAPRSRVWQAIADSRQFGEWFGLAFDEPFEAGRTLRGRVTFPEEYKDLPFEVRIVAVEPERYFAYRWHPYAVDLTKDYSGEPMTLVEFTLEADGPHTVLTVVESGFDQVPLDRRAEAFRMNEGGWAAQVENVARYVEGR